MKVQGFINVYPANDPGAMGTQYGEHKTGSGIFTTREVADGSALPSRLAVAEFEYEKIEIEYANVYKGEPWNAFDAAITLGKRRYATEEEAKAGIDDVPIWGPHHIGIVKLNG
jgi:hypothetical protein